LEVTRILAIRHGETAWNADGRVQGHIDVPLNERGRAQAQALVQALEGEDLAAVYSSDLARARETAEAFAGPAGMAVQTDVQLRERSFGRLEGFSFAEVQARWPEEAVRWRQREPGFAVGGGESLLVFQARCVAAITRLAAAHAGQAIAVVAHGGVLDVWYRMATHIELTAPRTWMLPNAAVNRLLYSPEGFTLVGWGDVGHLEAA
jgi:2,3-bisphosphoglycerate-dependent phosphoglycerate mutase